MHRWFRGRGERPLNEKNCFGWGVTHGGKGEGSGGIVFWRKGPACVRGRLSILTIRQNTKGTGRVVTGGGRRGKK